MLDTSRAAWVGWRLGVVRDNWLPFWWTAWSAAASIFDAHLLGHKHTALAGVYLCVKKKWNLGRYQNVNLGKKICPPWVPTYLPKTI